VFGDGSMLELSHKKLDVWKLSIDFTSAIYDLVKDFPTVENNGLKSQLRRAAVSIPSNIAEGCARQSIKEKKRFYEIARSSLVEIDTQLEIAKRLKYINESKIKALSETMNHIFAMLSNIIKKYSV
jgi:four helix bundle protein